MPAWLRHFVERVAWPGSHFMALAPLDVWARVLRGSRVPGRYWGRLAWCLFCSTLSTAGTLPERVAMWPVLRWRHRAGRGRPPVDGDVLIVLGYFRSGTTHLHYLLSCDRQWVTPRWYQCLAPHGFWISWTFLRVFLVPFLGNTRPQDDVSFGPEWPAEDDFALCNGCAASSLPGRFVVPQRYEHWRRFHFLEGLTPAELERWRRGLWGFAWKIGRFKHGRGLLLKTPSHTARADELMRLFGAERVKFVYLSRDPVTVVRSNVAMHARLHGNRLQDAPDELEIERRIVEEYRETEKHYRDARPRIPAGHLAEMRYDDLRRDPIGELKRVYGELGLRWSEAAERRMKRYLTDVSDYRPSRHEEWDEARAERVRQMLGGRHGGTEARRHKGVDDGPATESCGQARGTVDDAGRRDRRAWLGAGVGIVAACLCAVAWIAIAAAVQNRYDTFVWPAGIVIGYAVWRAAGVGSARLGAWAGALTIVTLLCVAVPNTRLVSYGSRDAVEWQAIRDTTLHELTAGPTIFWTIIGAATAYRFASRRRAGV